MPAAEHGSYTDVLFHGHGKEVCKDTRLCYGSLSMGWKPSIDSSPFSFVVCMWMCGCAVNVMLVFSVSFWAMLQCNRPTP